MSLSRVATITALFVSAAVASAPAQDKGKRECGFSEDQLKKIFKSDTKKDPKEFERSLGDHFKKNHADGICHCSCEHPAPAKGNNGVGNGIDPQPPGNPPINDGPGTGPGNPGNKKNPSCGLDRESYKKHQKKKGKDDRDCDRETDEHFSKVHPRETTCHCACEHSSPPKGNNGVGNGIDPQPPGNPPVNDGPGTEPGNPGNKKHGVSDGDGKHGKPQDPGDKGKGGKGKPDEDGEDKDKDKGKGGPPSGKGKPKS